MGEEISIKSIKLAEIGLFRPEVWKPSWRSPASAVIRQDWRVHSGRVSIANKKRASLTGASSPPGEYKVHKVPMAEPVDRRRKSRHEETRAAWGAAARNTIEFY